MTGGRRGRFTPSNPQFQVITPWRSFTSWVRGITSSASCTRYLLCHHVIHHYEYSLFERPRHVPTRCRWHPVIVTSRLLYNNGYVQSVRPQEKRHFPSPKTKKIEHNRRQHNTAQQTSTSLHKLSAPRLTNYYSR